jgi:hypothetical protein
MKNLQKYRAERGADFQREVRLSWRLIPHIWRTHLKEGGGTRPADDLVLTEYNNLLMEMKRTESDVFRLSYLRPDQLTGLLAFDKAIGHNIGLVFVSFLHDDIDEAYGFRLTDHVYSSESTLLLEISREAMQKTPSLYRPLPRIYVEGKPAYDLKGVIKWGQP